MLLDWLFIGLVMGERGFTETAIANFTKINIFKYNPS